MAATTLKEAVIQALNKAASSFYTAQTLTPEQKQVARENIGAMSSETSPSVPTGTLLPFAGTVIPAGYLPCNGANVSRTEYANLFAVIGTKYGEGDGVSTFTLPNLDGRVLQGTTDTGEVGNYLEPQLPNITGTINPIISTSSAAFTGSLEGKDKREHDLDPGSYGVQECDYELQFDASKSSSLYTTGGVLQTAALQCLVCIKV